MLDRERSAQVPLTVFVAVVFGLLGFLVGGLTSHLSILERISALEVQIKSCSR